MKTDDIIGFFLGFFFGCCGLLFALLLRGEYLRGVIAGILANMAMGAVMTGLGLLAGAMEGAASSAPPIPWELVAAFGIVVVFSVGLAAGAVWAFVPRDDGDDDEPPAPPSRDEYITWER
ncbi:MAG: hypothetical protein R3F59_12735 [Myxococcota bacterium]